MDILEEKYSVVLEATSKKTMDTVIKPIIFNAILGLAKRNNPKALSRARSMRDLNCIILGDAKRIDILQIRLEIVATCVEALQDIIGPNKFARQPSNLLKNLYQHIVDYTEYELELTPQFNQWYATKKEQHKITNKDNPGVASEF